MRLSWTRTVIGSIWLLTAMVAAVPAAQALPGAAWASRTAPLKNYYDGQYTGAAFGTWQGFREDQGRGSRVQDSSYHRYPQPDTRYSNRGSYVRTSWYTNGSYCYVASFSETGGSVGCGSGWHGAGSTNTGSTKSTSWQYWETWDRVDPEAESERGKMQVCENLVNWRDNCSTAYFVRGSHY